MQTIEKELIKIKNLKKAKLFSRYFKTSKGQYGEGDIFLGISVPECRNIAKKYINIEINQVLNLLKNKYHEIRLVGLFLLVYKFKYSNNEIEKEKIVRFYLKNTKYINNWDLVDCTAYQILGNYLLFKKDRKILYKLANSKNVWEQRIAIVSTFAFIKNGESKDIFEISKKLFGHKHDLIHKAMGWMLREVGKNVGEKELKQFLIENMIKIPRTTLRYSIEKFNKKERQKFLKGV